MKLGRAGWIRSEFGSGLSSWNNKRQSGITRSFHSSAFLPSYLFVAVLRQLATLATLATLARIHRRRTYTPIRSVHKSEDSSAHPRKGASSRAIFLVLAESRISNLKYLLLETFPTHFARREWNIFRDGGRGRSLSIEDTDIRLKRSRGTSACTKRLHARITLDR